MAGEREGRKTPRESSEKGRINTTQNSDKGSKRTYTTGTIPVPTYINDTSLVLIH